MKPPKVKIEPVAAVIGVLVLAYAVNVVGVKWFNYPVLLCYFEPVFNPFWKEWSAFIRLVAVVVLVATLLMQRYGDSLRVALVLLLLFGVPQFATAIFGLGATCD